MGANIDLHINVNCFSSYLIQLSTLYIHCRQKMPKFLNFFLISPALPFVLCSFYNKHIPFLSLRSSSNCNSGYFISIQIHYLLLILWFVTQKIIFLQLFNLFWIDTSCFWFIEKKLVNVLFPVSFLVTAPLHIMKQVLNTWY